MDRLGMIQGPALRLEVSLHPIHSAETHYEPARELCPLPRRRDEHQHDQHR